MTAYPQPGTQAWLAAKAGGPVWRYRDARGVSRIGYVERTIDRGGTDVSYYMRDRSTGELTIINGPAAKDMVRLWAED